MTIEIRQASIDDVHALVELQIGLFDEDAGTHDPTVDVHWPRRAGADDVHGLLGNADAVVLVASAGADNTHPVGFLVGYLQPTSDTRLTELVAVLRSLYIHPEHRRCGAASKLVSAFVDWATTRDCDEVHVDHYTANEAAAALYQRLGFAARSTSRARRLRDA